jgi:hypothetical protein
LFGDDVAIQFNIWIGERNVKTGEELVKIGENLGTCNLPRGSEMVRLSFPNILTAMSVEKGLNYQYILEAIKKELFVRLSRR